MKVGICFSKELVGDTPLSHVVIKLPVYIRLLELMIDKGWETYILTRKVYKGGGVFGGGWKFTDLPAGRQGGKFVITKDDLLMDLVYDRTGGVTFPEEGDSLTVVNERRFKVLAWDKWAAYQVIGEYMPRTFLVENENEIPSVVAKIKTDNIVLKPFNGLKGLGVFIGRKDEAIGFKFPENFPRYIAQEFVDTTGGISNVTPGLHDLRVAIVNGKPVWCHVRVPMEGTFLANAAQGGNLTEVDYDKVPDSIKHVVREVSTMFSRDYDNPIYSLDFGIDKNGTPSIFEINDQLGFPKWEMEARDSFLTGLISNFEKKLV